MYLPLTLVPSPSIACHLQMFEVEVSGQVQDIFREYCLAFCLALRPADIARGFQAQAPRPVEPVPLGALISALHLTPTPYCILVVLQIGHLILSLLR